MAGSVRKDPRPWSAAVHGLLGWLHETAPGAAPRPISLDERDWVVSWVPGEVSGIPYAPFLLRPEAMASVGRLLRRIHDATAGYEPPSGAMWAVGARPKAAGEVVTHGDVGAGNIVWRDGEAAALIDWELAEPGPPWRDLALAAWTLVPLVPPARQRRAGFGDGAPLLTRLAALCDGYGDVAPEAVLGAYRKTVADEITRRRELGGRGVEPWAHFAAIGQTALMEEAAAWFDRSPLAPLAG